MPDKLTPGQLAEQVMNLNPVEYKTFLDRFNIIGKNAAAKLKSPPGKAPVKKKTATKKPAASKK